MFNLLLVIAAMIVVGLAGRLPSELNILDPFNPNVRIVGGEPISIMDAPYQVSLQASGSGFCGGTIISEEWILTAAHCAAYEARYLRVRAGTDKMMTGGSIHYVEKFIKHGMFTTNLNGIPIHDIGLIKLKTPLQLDVTKKPIDLFEMNEESIPGTVAIITGWGAVSEGGDTAEILQRVSIPIVSQKVCNDAYSSYGGIPAGQICAAYPEGGKDACQGDSGGPVTIGGRLAGIVSWGKGCARPGYPGVYTEVASYRDWILETTGL